MSQFLSQTYDEKGRKVSTFMPERAVNNPHRRATKRSTTRRPFTFTSQTPQDDPPAKTKKVLEKPKHKYTADDFFQDSTSEPESPIPIEADTSVSGGQVESSQGEDNVFTGDTIHSNASHEGSRSPIPETQDLDHLAAHTENTDPIVPDTQEEEAIPDTEDLGAESPDDDNENVAEVPETQYKEMDQEEEDQGEEDQGEEDQGKEDREEDQREEEQEEEKGKEEQEEDQGEEEQGEKEQEVVEQEGDVAPHEEVNDVEDNTPAIEIDEDAEESVKAKNKISSTRKSRISFAATQINISSRSTPTIDSSSKQTPAKNISSRPTPAKDTLQRSLRSKSSNKTSTPIGGGILIIDGTPSSGPVNTRSASRMSSPVKSRSRNKITSLSSESDSERNVTLTNKDTPGVSNDTPSGHIIDEGTPRSGPVEPTKRRLTRTRTSILDGKTSAETVEKTSESIVAEKYLKVHLTRTSTPISKPATKSTPKASISKQSKSTLSKVTGKRKRADLMKVDMFKKPSAPAASIKTFFKPSDRFQSPTKEADEDLEIASVVDKTPRPHPKQVAKPGRPKKQKIIPAGMEDMEILMWDGGRISRKIDDVMDLDIAINVIAEVIRKACQQEDDQQIQEIIEGFGEVTSKAIGGLIDGYMETKTLKKALRRVTSQLKDARKELLSLQEDKANRSEDLYHHKERLNVTENSFSEEHEITDWLGDIKDLNTRYEETAPSQEQDMDYGATANIPALLTLSQIKIKSMDSLREVNSRLEQWVQDHSISAADHSVNE
ncbi:unnamed protein product [Owenia fusiformis]|uniref:MLF1-interacting protein n=1 Tax=Owenia fusiformis TaxID=6347 RepID=A0A8S4PNI9_OWEFU|nr:unnamed protein product [Owenia fusiformis]